GGIVVTLIVLLALSNSTAGFVGAVLLGLLTVAIAIALAIWLGTKLSLVPSVLFLEHATLRTAIRRSWFLTSGNTYFWRTFGIEILVAAIVSVASYVVLVPVTVLLTIFSTLSNPNGSVEVVDNTFYVTLAVTTILTALISSITSIISTAATALIYIDLRMRREGLDLTLSRFVEARQVGDTSVADPYLPIPTSSQPGFGSTPQNGSPSNSGPTANSAPPSNSAPTASTATDDRGGPPKDSPWV
ncbi:MAG: hypothetical protein JWQ43_1616, partial [Glaciihabitans sp.]|nr:hypothetical protein [Glaciihabitans sp.]